MWMPYAVRVIVYRTCIYADFKGKQQSSSRTAETNGIERDKQYKNLSIYTLYTYPIHYFDQMY